MIDLDASFHTTTYRDVLENYIAESYKKVYLTDGETLDIIGIGNVSLKVPNGSV